jgi:F-type H+-transporting ATPase subunit b
MSIEISQILTHLVGFLIAFFILKKYAWGPVLQMLDDRRQKIADEFADIEAQKQQTETLLHEYEERLRKIEEEARARINEAVAEGQKVAAEIKSDAQEDARRITARAKSELERDVERARAQLKQDMVIMTLGATERLLHEKFDESANRKLIERFLSEAEKVT